MNSDLVGFAEAPFGELKVWDWPQERVQYVIGADVALGKAKDLAQTRRDPGSMTNLVGDGKRHDYSAAIVIDQMTAQHVASWHGYVTPPEYAAVLAALGIHYNMAQLVVEVNSFGYGVVETLMNFLRYPNLYVNKIWNRTSDELGSTQVGWTTTNSSRALLINRIHEWLASSGTTRDAALLDELRTMQFDDQGVPRAKGKDKDDRVMALGMALQGRYEQMYGYEGGMNSPDKPGSHLPYYDRKVWEDLENKRDERKRRTGGVRLRPLPRPRGWS